MASSAPPLSRRRLPIGVLPWLALLGGCALEPLAAPAAGVGAASLVFTGKTPLDHVAGLATRLGEVEALRALGEMPARPQAELDSSVQVEPSQPDGPPAASPPPPKTDPPKTGWPSRGGRGSRGGR